MSALELYLLGSPRLVRDGVALAFDSRKNLALTAYLAITGQSHTREALITLLWPELEPSRGRAGLRRNLSVIRKALDGEWLVVDREIIGCDPGADFWLDVAQFRVLLRAHGHPEEEVCPGCLTALTEAAKLYQGDFMAGFSLRDSANFDEWQFFQTEGLRQELATALERLVRGHSAQAAYESAIPYARRWLTLDPLHEPAHRGLMELYGRAGQRSAALRQYVECARVLEEELGLAPSEKTTALYEKLRTRGVDPGPGTRHNLPAQVTPFVGREEELREVQARLSVPDCRLLTLVGTGGIGKTRLALRAAELALNTLADDFEHGVYYVRLGGLQSVEGIVPAVAEALGFRFHEKGEPLQQLLAYLRQRRLLLVMDNFEHLLEGVELVTEILRSAPEVKLLVTSRIRLSLRGEHLLPVEGMDVPDADAGAKALDFSAVKLFVQGARLTLAGPDWEPGPEALRDVISVCRLVEGMPLGILLAAAWVEMLSPAGIAAEIGRGLDFLETDLQDVPPRQRSLRAVFDHSWRLLNEREQSVMHALSVFRGGFTGEAAREVAGASLRELKALLGKSFLERGAGGRYEVHDLLRSYAAEKLDGSPGGGDAARDRHSAYLSQSLQAWATDLKGPGQLRALAQMDADLENIRAAWNWGVARRSLEHIEQAVEGLWLFYTRRGLYQEGEAVYRTAAQELEAIEVRRGRRLLATILVCQGSFNYTLGRTGLAHQNARAGYDILEEPQLAGHDLRRERALTLWRLAYGVSDVNEMQRLFEESLALCQELDDRWSTATMLRALGWVARKRGEYKRAYRLVDDSLAIRRTLGDPWGVASSLQMLGSIAGRHGRRGEAERLLRDSIAAFEAIRDRAGAATGWGRLGLVVAAQGRFEEALALCRKSLDIYTDCGAEEGKAWWRIWMADCLAHLGQYGAAQAEAELALAYYQQGGGWGMAYALLILGLLALARAAYPEARELLEAAGRMHRADGNREGEALARTTLAYADLGMGDLGRAAGQLVDGLGLARQIGAGHALASRLPALALWLAQRGEGERAVEVFATASCDPLVQNSRWFREVVGDRIRAATAALPPEVMHKAEERGRARDPEALLAELLAELAE